VESGHGGERVKNKEIVTILKSQGAHQASCLAKNVGEGVNELHNRVEAINELSIVVPILLELVPILFE
jgi:hypothetical protein